mmetsp:Transcript_55990/g.100654  ORF Transcript_55990/g.100654 Transcript_55990/m.100654 type:complete len:211 (+) Transcript_55990:341-973(+)
MANLGTACHRSHACAHLRQQQRLHLLCGRAAEVAQVARRPESAKGRGLPTGRGASHSWPADYPRPIEPSAWSTQPLRAAPPGLRVPGGFARGQAPPAAAASPPAPLGGVDSEPATGDAVQSTAPIHGRRPAHFWTHPGQSGRGGGETQAAVSAGSATGPAARGQQGIPAVTPVLPCQQRHCLRDRETSGSWEAPGQCPMRPSLAAGGPAV